MRRRIIIIISVVVVASALVVMAIYVVDRSPVLQNGVLRLTNQTFSNVNTVVPTVTNTNAAVNTDRANVTYVARNFAEIYGSGTNQNKAAHLIQAKQWGTTDYNRVLDRQILLERSQSTTPFHGTVSAALVVSITRQTATAAAVTIGLQREETLDSTAKSFNQELYIDLIKQGNDWKVNAARWQVL